jgi:hypothetical protein
MIISSVRFKDLKMNLSKNTNAKVIKMNPIIVPKVFLAINLPIIPKNDIRPIF